MRVVLPVLLLLCSLSAQQTAPSQPAPIDYEAINFTSYGLQVRIEPATKGFFVRGSVTIKNESPGPLARVAMQVSSSLRWATIKRGGVNIPFEQTKIASDVNHTGAMTEATFSLAPALKPNETVTLEVGYAGTIARDPMRLVRLGAPRDKALLAEWDQISPEYTAIRGVGYANWYPVAIAPGRMMDGNTVFENIGKWKQRHTETSMKLDVTLESAEAEAALVSNGAVQQTATAYDVTFSRFGMDVPVLVAANFVRTSLERVELFSLGTANEALRSSLQSQTASFAGNRNAKVQLVQASEEIAPFESGTLFILPSSQLTAKVLAEALTHSLAHAAFYSPRAWINEGVAHLAQAIQAEAKYGRAGALKFISDRQGALALASPDDPSKAKQSLITAYDDLYYRTKALYVWWMLRDMVGQDALVRALNKYDPAQDKEPSYIQRLIQAESKRDLEWFFSDWVYRDKGLPEFKIENIHARQDLRGGYLVTVTVENSGYAGAEAPVKIRTRAGDTWLRVQVKGKSRGSARVTVPQPPIDAVVNDGSVPETDMNDNTFTVPVAAESSSK